MVSDLSIAELTRGVRVYFLCSPPRPSRELWHATVFFAVRSNLALIARIFPHLLGRVRRCGLEPFPR